jgi:N-acetylglucosamine kinase-like BadF-type ATPase
LIPLLISEPLKMHFGGVEGGATHSMFMVCDAEANVLATVEGPGTNLFQLGLDETCHRVKKMVQQGLELAGLDPNLTLEGLGLSLSGCEVDEVNKQLAARFKELYPGTYFTMSS